jgi:hypothetical protein
MGISIKVFIRKSSYFLAAHRLTYYFSDFRYILCCANIHVKHIEYFQGTTWLGHS